VLEIAPGMIQVCLCVDSAIGSSGFEAFDSARALRRSEASLLAGCMGIVEMEEAVEGIRAIDGREDRALIVSQLCFTRQKRGEICA